MCEQNRYVFGPTVALLFSEETENVEKFQKRLVKVTPEHNDECKKLLQLMGIPYIEVLLVSLLTTPSVTYCGTKYRKLTLHFNIMFTRDHYYESMFRNISQCATGSVISRRSSELLSVRSIAAA